MAHTARKKGSPLKVDAVPQTLGNGYYFGCDTCADGTLTAAALNGTGPYTYQWSMLPPGTASFRIEGASLYFDDLRSVTGGNGTALIPLSATATLNGAAPGTWYAVTATDQLGCTGGKALSLEGTSALGGPGWKLNGNSGLDANGQQQWLGTNDSTDMVMKANNQVQIRLEADGTSEFLGGVKLTLLNDPTAVYERIPMVDASGRITGGATIKSLYTSLLIGEYGAGCLDHAGNPIPSWESGIGKIFTDCSPVKVGIGTTDPLTRLDVRGQTYSQKLSVNTYAQDAKVTIRGGTPGTQSEFKALEVQDNSGNAAFEVFNDGKVQMKASDGTLNFESGADGSVTVGAPLTQTGDEAVLYFGDDNHYIKSVWGGGLRLGTLGAVDALIIEEVTGKVGIGVGPDHIFGEGMLEVGGTIRSRKVVTEEVGWPDFVFDPDHRPMPFADLKAYIEKHGHLPEIPTSEEIEKNGLDHGALILLQMKKIEELTLYVLDLEDRLSKKENE